MQELTKVRRAARTWHEEVSWLKAKGYTIVFKKLDALAIEASRCERCEAEVIYHGYSMADVVNRSYGVCHDCGHWFEF